MVHVPESESLEHKILAFCKFCLKFYLPNGELISTKLSIVFPKEMIQENFQNKFPLY